MAKGWLVLFFVVHALIAQVQLCEIPEGNSVLIRSLNQMLLKETLSGTNDPNPSVYIGLRLSEDHNLKKEDEYLQRLKSSMETISRSALNIKESEPKTGLLALHLLAQKASCDNIDRQVKNKLMTHLKYHLHHEKENIAQNLKPLSNYYQYSLGVLAMCVNDKILDRHVIHKLILAQENKQLGHGGQVSIDTEAMVGLSLLCLKRSNIYSRELITEIKQMLKRIKANILASQNSDGHLGNIYSTPIAVQFLLEMGSKKDKESCSKAISALLEAVHQGKFSNPMMISQLIPVLHQKSYMDVSNVQCEEMKNNPLLISSSILDVDTVEEMIQVRLVVADQTFDKIIEVPAKSSLLDVLKSAQKHNSDFSFETKKSLHGPFLTTVNNVVGYWQLFKDPDASLLEGIADYVPVNGETIILRLGTL